MAPRILEEASVWFVAMREPRVTPDVHESFAEWLRASPLHVQAYLEIAALWGDAAHVGKEYLSGPASISDEADASGNVVALPTLHSRPPAPGEDEAAPRRARLWLAAAVLLVSVAAGAITWWHVQRVPTYQAGVGEQRVIVLEDGSVIRLNARSRVQVRMSQQLRLMDLLEGQVLVYVAKDRARPFVVRDGSVAVRAVGTAFDVNRRHSGTVVTVIEGRVLVDAWNARAHPGAEPFVAQPAREQLPATQSPGTASGRTAVALSAGDQLRIASDGVLERKTGVSVASATGWLEHTLTFDGETLSTVVEELNRYSRTPIVIADSSLAELRINAVLHSTNPESFLRFMRRLDGVEVTASDRQIRISRHADK